MMNVKIKQLLAVCALSFCMNAVAAAENACLAVVEVPDAVPEVRAELWGDRLANGYADNLLLLFRNKDGMIKAAYNPTVKGGYNCLLDMVSVGSEGNQVLLSAAQGNWQRPTEYRIIDFKDYKDIREVFTAADNYGVVQEAVMQKDRLTVTMSDGSSSTMQVDAGLLEQIPAERRQAHTEKITSLAAVDVDNDGRQEVLTVQKISADKNVLADIGAVWKLDADGAWNSSGFTILVAGDTAKENTINDGREGEGYTVLPRKIVAPGGEATYPVVAYKDDVLLQNKVNKVLQEENEDYLQKFISGEADSAFNVLRADKDLLSIQLISGKKSFVHHHVNLDPQTGNFIRLEDILRTDDSDLLPLLNLLNTNDKIEFTEGLPTEWYLADRRLCLVVNVCGQDEVSCYAIGNLHKFLRDKKWLD